jgi:hypothetical protein
MEEELFVCCIGVVRERKLKEEEAPPIKRTAHQEALSGICLALNYVQLGQKIKWAGHWSEAIEEALGKANCAFEKVDDNLWEIWIK